MKSLPAHLNGRYTIERELGRGSTGVVYQARDEFILRRVAIKILLGDVAADDVRHRFTREAQAVATLRHPNILEVLDVGEADGRPFYVMPFVDGESLDRLLQRSGKLPISDALTIAIAVAGALEHAHHSGIIHRDVKPSNVLVPNGNYPDAKLTDFGLQGVLDTQTQHTRVGQIFGTPTYMSPEQVRGLAQSSATDVFGLGVLLYQMVYGKTPYSGDTAVQLFNSILHEAVIFPAEPAVADHLLKFIERCLDKDPSRRPVSPLRDLQRIRTSSLPPPIPDSLLSVAAERSSSPARTALITRRSPRPSSAATHQRRVYVIVFAAVAAAVGYIALVIAARGSRRIVESALGVGLMLAGIVVGTGVRQWLQTRKVMLADETSRLLDGTRNRAALTQSLAIEVDQLLTRCRTVDERFLGASIAIMIDEYQQAQGFDDRHRALAASVDFLEKLMKRLSPWYIRYEKLIAAIVALLGIIPGVFKIVTIFSRP